MTFISFINMLPYEKRLQNRKIIVKEPAEPGTKYGKKPEDRTIEELLQYGIININKPKGPTSHQVSEYVKKILHCNKAGQSGTLDPGVTGVLPIGINKATRCLQALLNAGKEYVCLMHVHKPITDEELNSAIDKFTGQIKQLPPIKSAVKRQWRFRTVYYIEILETKNDNQDILFRVGCEAGTYIRKLCSDMGDYLGCGAHMAQLVRSRVGQFTDENQVTLQELKDTFELTKDEDVKDKAEKKLREIILPMEKAVEHIPHVYVFDSVIPFILNGCDVMLPGVCKFHDDIEPNELVAVMSLKGELIGLGHAELNSQKMLDNEKGVAVRFEKVLMAQDAYKKD